MSKLTAPLQHAIAFWRAELAEAQTGDHPGVAAGSVEMRRVSVIVAYEGDVEALRAAGLDTGFDQNGRISGLIAFRDLAALEAVPGVTSIVMEPRVRIGLDGTIKEMKVPWKVPPATPWPGRGAKVIVAIVDTGIDIFHESFRTADGKTRILELWDQGATAGGSAPPAGFMQIGRVYSSDNIRDALAAGPPFASIDRIGHGTHVAGIAAGNGNQDDRCSFPGHYVGVAPESDLIVVKALDVATSSTRDALQWCAQARTRHPANKAVVINCSFGSDLGPHDGTGDMDGMIDEILRPSSGPPPGIAIVVLAGNSGSNEIHESGTVAAHGTANVAFYVPNNSLNPNALEIWYNGDASLAVELVAPVNQLLPGPDTTFEILPGVSHTPFTIGKMTLSVTSDSAPLPDHNNKKRFRVDFITPSGFSTRSGPWQLKLRETAGVAANWSAWFATSNEFSYPTFRLPKANSEPRRRENTIWEPGTSRNAITVASYNDDKGSRADSSSQGPPGQVGIPVGEYKPTIAAPGVGVAAPRSRNDPDKNSSCCDQLVIDKSGTSMATPHVAGLVALMLQKNPTLTFEQIRQHLQHSARVDGIPSAEVPPEFDHVLKINANALWGSGKVDAAAALTEISVGGGGGGGGSISFDTSELGYVPENLGSRLSDWRKRFGPRPGLMLFVYLVSEHVDEVLRLVNKNPRVGAVWRRHGGPLLVRRLLYGPPPQDTLMPAAIEGCDVTNLLKRFLPVLKRFGGPRLIADIARFRSFAEIWPDGDLQRLDDEAQRLATVS